MESKENTPDQNPANSDKLVHGFRRGTKFGFTHSFEKTSSGDKYGYILGNNRRPISKSALECTQEHGDLLERLGRSMIDITDADDPAEFSSIDSGYTYFGQFIDHDLTLDADSRMEGPQDARTITNYRTPNLDLDSVYGDGPAVSPFMFNVDAQLTKFLVGTENNEFDLPRMSSTNAPNFTRLGIIGDPRNDENLFVAQLHMSMLRFHNAVVDELMQRDTELQNPQQASQLFRRAQSEVRRHYQWVVLNDYVRTVVGSEMLEDIQQNGFKLFGPKQHRYFFMPVEFSVAAFRFGHSMIRNRYRFNRNFTNESFMSAFNFTKTSVPSNWVIDWSNFFGEAGRSVTNKARKIDTQVAFRMGQLPPAHGAPSDSLFTVLSARNLVRGMALQVPSGQAVALRLKARRLTNDELLRIPHANPTQEQQDHHEEVANLLKANDALLLRQTPLWYYILKEAEVLNGGNQLGPVGGRIVAEVFLRILTDSKDSILSQEAVNSDWKPTFGLNSKAPADYKIVDLLRFANTLTIPSVS